MSYTSIFVAFVMWETLKLKIHIALCILLCMDMIPSAYLTYQKRDNFVTFSEENDVSDSILKEAQRVTKNKMIIAGKLNEDKITDKIAEAMDLGEYLYVFCHHKGGIKAHTKLADHIQLRLFILLHSLLKSPGAGFGNGAQVALQFFLAHAAAVIGNGQGAGGFVGGETDKIFAPVQAGVSALHGGVIPLINGIGSIADQLPQKNLLVGVDGVYHQVQKPLAFRFELFFGHGIDRLSLNLALSYMEC